jgi:hypothetical protein
MPELIGIQRPNNGNYGFPPADARAIRSTEERIGIPLAPSLRQFYEISNGWAPVGCFIYRVRPIEEIGYLRDLDPHLHSIAKDSAEEEGPWDNDPEDARLNEYRMSQGTAVMRSLLLTSDGDAAMWLADTAATTTDGEWMFGRWSSWNPGIDWNFRSFLEIFKDELAFLEDTLDESGG